MNEIQNNHEPQTLELEIVQPTALESIERAQIDMQITTARRYPRSLAIVKKKMLDLATLDQETAESCFYRLNRKGKMIEGPSIRLAEIAVSSFGNLRYGSRVIGNDGRVITAQGYCHDLENNVMSQVEVQRRITDRDGNTYNQDMQTITGNAACAIAARNAVFKVVPFAFVKPIFSAAKQAAVGDIKTLAERRTAMLKKFAAMGIDEKRVTSAVSKQGVEEIGLEELETLIGLHNAVRDGEQNVDEAFPISIAKAIIAKPKVGRPKKVKLEKKQEQPAPALTSLGERVQEIEKRLSESGHTVTQLLEVAVEQEWIDKPVTNLAETPLASVGEEKLMQMLEFWDVVAEQLK